MASIIVRINSRKLDHIKDGMESRIAQFVEQKTGQKIIGDGYDYMGHTDLGIFFKTDDPVEQIPVLISLLEANEFDGNRLKGCFKLMVSSDRAPIDYWQIYPKKDSREKGDFWKRMFQNKA